MLDRDDEVYDFGRRLRALREEQRLSQAKAAKKVGVSKNSLYRYENNLQEPTFSTLVRFAVCYHTSLDYLAGLDNTAVVTVQGLSPEKKKLVCDFMRCFVEGQAADK